MKLLNEHDYDPVWLTKQRVKASVPEQVDVAIVGAGLGGLVSGAYLSQQGYKVAVFDQHYVAGGCCTQFSRGGPRNRYNFDIGLHYIGDCGPTGKIPRVLAGLGIDIDYEPMDQNGFDTLVFPDFQFAIPADHDVYRDRFVEMFPKEKRGIDRYVKFLKEVDAFSQKIDAAKGKMGMGMAVWAMTQGRLAAKYQHATLLDVLKDCTSNPQVQAIMAGQSGDYGLPPSRVSASLHAGLVNHYFHGAYYTKGGGQVIADKVSQYIEAHGGSVHLRQGIGEIVVENGRAVGVRTEPHKGKTQEVRAAAVLSNADIKVTMEDLVGKEKLPEEWQQKTENFEMAAAIFMTCLGVKGDMRERGMGKTNYWAFDSYDVENFYATADDMKPKGCYITSASLKDPETAHHAPEGIQSVEVMAILSGKAAHWHSDQQAAEDWDYKKQQRYLELKNSTEENLIQRLDNLFPGSKENVVFKESASPMSHIRYTRATDGTGYGLACTPEQFFAGRPGYEGPIEGLFLTGANTRSGHGVLGAMQSGHRAAKKVAKALGSSVPDLPEVA